VSASASSAPSHSKLCGLCAFPSLFLDFEMCIFSSVLDGYYISSRSGIRILASSLHILRQSQLCQILRLFELRHELREVLFFFSVPFPYFHRKELNLPVCASNWTITCFSLFKLSVPVRLRCIPAAARSHLLASLVSGDLHARRYDPFRSITQLYDSLVLSFSLSSCSMVTSGMTWLLLVQ
jgi:hypothetical protein